MNRISIVVASPLSTRNPKYLPGVLSGTEKQIQFLKSPAGGAWLDSEICFYKNPTLNDIYEIHALCDGADIANVFVSCHGLQQNKQVFLQINDKDVIPDNYFATGALRQITSIECCRKQVSWHRDTGGIAGMQKVYSEDQLKLARKLYELHILNSSLGHVIVYSASANEYSWVSDEGGLFTRALLASIDNWHGGNSSEVLTVETAFGITSKRMKGLKINQTPQCNYTRVKALSIPIAINPTAYISRHVDTKRQSSNSGAALVIPALVLTGLGIAIASSGGKRKG